MKTFLSASELLALSLFVICSLAPTKCQSQATPAPNHSAACKPNTAEPSGADIAFFKHDAKKAEALYAAAFAKDPSDSRSRELEIDSLMGLSKKDEARKKAEDWAASDPKDPYAIISMAEIRFDDGDWPESYALTLKAASIAPCLPVIYEDLAEFESLAGYRATAKKHIVTAHQLFPNNPGIRSRWIGTLDQEQKIEEAKKFVADEKLFDEKQRTAQTRAFDRTVANSENRCELVSVTGPAVIPMTHLYGAAGNKEWGLEVAFNGHKQTLQIDTGASGFILSHSTGAAIGLPSIGKSRVGGFGGGSNNIDLSLAKSVRIGGLEFANCPVEVLAVSGVMGGSHIQGNRMDNDDGLVGSDIFSRYLVTLDYVKHEIRLEPLPQIPGAELPASELDPLGGRKDRDWMVVDRYIAPSMQSWTKIYRRGHQLLMPTRISSDKVTGKPKLFMVDTGNFTNLIDVNVAKEITHTDNSITHMRGLGGSVNEMFEAGHFTLDFAGLRLPVIGMDSIDLGHMGVGGFLGYPVLSQLVMHLDYRDDLAFFEAPNGKKR